MSLDHLWAGWRSAYIEQVTGGGPPPGGDDDGEGDGGDGSLFERILAHPGTDEERHIIHRGTRCSVLLNIYPYTNGHMMALPNRATADLEALDDEERDELWRLVADAVTALKRAYRCDGVNVGMNLGRAGGAGVPDHLHVHVLPRWNGDTNFMTAVAGTRVLPEPLDTTWHKLRAAWPGSPDGR